MTKWMLASGTQIVAGVTPGKGGQVIENIPVFSTVKEATQAYPAISVSCIVVPPLGVLGAVTEALDAGITFLYILSENVPLHDTVAIRKLGKQHQATILGPASVGFLSFPNFRLGYLGGETPFDGHIAEGDIAVISTSGGMTNELITSLSREKLGVRCAIAIGGGTVTGMTLAEAIHEADANPHVKRLALFIEPGQPLLHDLNNGFRPKKPFVILLAGIALDTMPKGLPYGHTGTILKEHESTLKEIRDTLRSKGVRCAATTDELIALMQHD